MSSNAPQPPSFVVSDQTHCSCTIDESNGPPFFLRTFDIPVDDDVEMRLCTDNAFESVVLVLVELYVC